MQHEGKAGCGGKAWKQRLCEQGSNPFPSSRDFADWRSGKNFFQKKRNWKAVGSGNSVHHSEVT